MWRDPNSYSVEGWKFCKSNEQFGKSCMVKFQKRCWQCPRQNKGCKIHAYKRVAREEFKFVITSKNKLIKHDI